MNINLIPESEQRRRLQRARLRLWMIVLTSAAAILVIPIGLDWSRRANAMQLRAKIETLDTIRRQVQSECHVAEREVKETQAQIERADALRSKRAWSAMVTLIAANVPADVWLTAIATDPPRPAPSVVSRRVRTQTPPPEEEENLTIEAPTKIIIEGYAPRAAEPFTFIRNLQDTQVFDTVSLLRSSLEPLEDGPYFRFSLVCEW